MPSTIRSPGQSALCAALIAERRQAGLTQVALAERLHCHQSMVARIESGERRIDVIELIIIARAIGCPVGKLVCQVEPTVPPGVGL